MRPEGPAGESQGGDRGVEAGSQGTGRPDNAAAIEPDPKVIDAVVQGYYTRGVDAVDRKRERSEKGYTIASAVAASLVAAGLVTHLDEKSTLVKVLGLAGLLFWLMAALLFIRVVALDVKLPEVAGYRDAGEFITGVAQRAREEIAVLNKRLNHAMVATVLAVALTFGALVSATVDTGGPKFESAQVVLTNAGDATVSKLCGRAVGDLYATVESGALSKPVVKFELPPGECDPSTEIELPKGDIAADKEVIKFPVFP
jgi:hypothetical protein